jgi:tetratricopeptide (TPR) repeat protein
MTTRGLAVLAIVTSLGAACAEQGENSSRVTLGGANVDASGGPPDEVRLQIDRGNIAYRAGEYEVALHHYQEAARRAPDEAPAWFGIAMAATELGDVAAVDSARARIRSLAPELELDAHHGAGTPHP